MNSYEEIYMGRWIDRSIMVVVVVVVTCHVCELELCVLIGRDSAVELLALLPMIDRSMGGWCQYHRSHMQ